MHNIKIPDSYNYIGCFLTFACNLKCSYCINRFKQANPKYKQLSGDEWIRGLNNIVTREDLPITLGGGEPTLHPDFYKIVNGVRGNIDLLTNAQFDIDTFTKNIDRDRLKRDAKYASIRISYHLETMWLTNTINKVRKLQDKGYSVGVWIVNHPKDYNMLKICKSEFDKVGIDCRMKEFLGVYKGKLYGSYKYPSAMDGVSKRCMCKPSEMLIAPNGDIHRCHYELYNNCRGYAHILDNGVKLIDTHMECNTYGKCNPCDIKSKFDRFQVSGHCSVSIKDAGSVLSL